MTADVATTCEKYGGRCFRAAVLDHSLGERAIAEPEPPPGLRPDAGKSVIAIEHLAACHPGARGHRGKGVLPCVTPRGGAHAPPRSA